MTGGRRTLSLATGLLSLGALGALFAFACGGPSSHVLSGRRFLPERDCLETLTSIDVVEGPDPGRACEPLCIIGQSPLLEGPAVFITTQCPPYPPTFDLSESNPDCAAAYAAYERLDICKGEGSTNPRDGGDLDAAAGPDASTEPDASSEPDAAGPDASPEPDAGELPDASTDDGGPSDASVDADGP